MYLRVTRGRTDPANADAVAQAVPAILAAIRQLPGCQDVRTGIDRASGRTVAVSSFDTLEHAQFTRETIGEPLQRLVAAGWQPEAPEIYEMVQ
ncbi:MAG: hypothetical protein QOF33_1112 [Thermomicrobiales bacterium]|jgi:quinol monooxygenase YgiN|nr:hypothetical protein [Thermomicrobiales bacterium]MEA2523091.1 hypothetical protein [Thermomicrobiales bacterium]MEA2583027.1 hypothetical protein [Thermomicrobiales bacterium]MEA2595556.1 hypothetical protein [Thermomicrobiales bacterium]